MKFIRVLLMSCASAMLPPIHIAWSASNDRTDAELVCYIQLSNAVLEEFWKSRSPEIFFKEVDRIGGAFGIANFAQRRCDENILDRGTKNAKSLDDADDYGKAARAAWIDYVKAIDKMLKSARNSPNSVGP